MIKLLLPAFMLYFFSFHNIFSQSDPISEIGKKWDLLDDRIVNNEVDTEDALQSMKYYQEEISKLFKMKENTYTSRSDWIFPLKNFTVIYYRENGNDYRGDKYNYFQGSNSKGHPAHDIMILDSNKDLLDDNTLKPVDVVSMSGGVVIATDSTWAPGSKLRGGKYVKIFDITNSGIFYYSHLSKLNVVPGEIVTAGSKIGEVGRTGRKAILPGGKTHLHVAFLRFVDGYPLPEDIIIDLRTAEKKLEKK